MFRSYEVGSKVKEVFMNQNFPTKYRGKRRDNGEWVEGYLFDDGMVNVEHYFIGSIVVEPYKGTADDDWDITGTCFWEVDPETICQFTELTDKNKNKIFENDITKLILDDGEVRYFKVLFKKVIRKILCYHDFDEQVAKVELNAICFEWNGYELFPCIDENGVSDVLKMEVVGNVFDNPELLKNAR